MKKNSKKFEKKRQIPITEERVEMEGQPYDVKRGKVCHQGGDLRLYYRAGNPDPMTWSRYDGTFSNRDMWQVRHDQSTLEGVMSMLGLEGAGSLEGSQWAIILGVVGMAIVAFIFLRPYLMGIMGF